MDIICVCSGCAAKFKVPDRAAGKKVRCPKCQATIDVPAASVASETPTVTATPKKPAASPERVPAPSDFLLPVKVDVSPVPSATPTAAAKPKPPVARPVQPTPVAIAPAAMPAAPTPPVTAVPVAMVPAGEENFSFPSEGFVKEKPKAVASRGKSSTTKKKSFTLPIMVAGGSVIAASVLALVMVFAFSGKPKSKPNSPSSSSGMLVLDWPESDRSGAKLVVDGQGATFPSKGPVELKLPPGKHSFVIMRRGYESITASVTLAASETTTYEPEWKASAVQIAKTDKPSIANSGVQTESGTEFKLGSGIVARGFEGWEQILALAKEKAAAQKKQILLLMGSSDGSPDTVRLGEALKAAGLPGGELAEKYVPVYIDLPRTYAALNMVIDREQNRDLLAEYQPKELPLLAMADEQGRPYYVQREWPDGFGNVSSLIEKMASQKAERDQLMVAFDQASPETQLDAAVALAEWISKNKVVIQYADDIDRWYQVGREKDADNSSGKLEVVTEVKLLSGLRNLDADDVVDVTRRFSILDPWLGKRTFKNPDRGFRLHLIAGGVSGKLGDERQSLAHLEKALNYKPTESELLERYNSIASALKNKDVLSSGSGFLIAEDGYILTNRHVVEGQGKVSVRIPQIDAPVPATVVNIDRDRDMALIKIEMPESFKASPVSVGGASLEQGLEVAAYGYPQGDTLGSGLKFTKGAISDLPNASLDNMILLDLRVNPGNSGGPLCDRQGRVIGMITAKTGGLDLDSYGMAIPASELITYLDAHLPDGSKRGQTAPQTGDWAEVSKVVRPAVLMILKTR